MEKSDKLRGNKKRMRAAQQLSCIYRFLFFFLSSTADAAHRCDCVCLINDSLTTWRTDAQSARAPFTCSHHFSQPAAVTATHAGNIARHCRSGKWRRRGGGDAASSHLSTVSLITCFFVLFFLRVALVESDILTVIYLLGCFPPQTSSSSSPSCQHLNQPNCQKLILHSPLLHTDTQPLKWKKKQKNAKTWWVHASVRFSFFLSLFSLQLWVVVQCLWAIHVAFISLSAPNVCIQQ